MRTATLLRRNLTHFWRTNLAVVAGVAAAVAVLAGALVVGDSVRASLSELFLQRLGKTDHVISAAGFFREELADEMKGDERFSAAGFADACPLVVLEGAVTHEETGLRAAGVQVYGVDQRFWTFHGRGAAETLAPRARDVLASPSLAEELKLKADDVLLLRIEKPSAIPAESLHGRKEDLGRTIRLTARGALDASHMGEFSARPQQAAVRAVFVPLRLLQQDLEQDGRVNAVLASSRDTTDTADERAARAKTEALEKILRERASLEDVGVKLRALPGRAGLSFETDSAVVSDALDETARAAAARAGLRVSPILSYLANSIRTQAGEIPYSLVTAVDEESFQRLRDSGARVADARAGGEARGGAQDNSTPSPASEELTPILLNEWAARDLNAQVGEAVALHYYVWKDDGRLATEGARFRLAGVIPFEGLAADRDLVPTYPGITESQSLSDWDPPFPVDLGRIRPQDEEYWKQYRTTPKAFIPLARGQQLWQTRFGKLTSLRIHPPDESTAQDGARTETSPDAYRENLKRELDPSRAGLAAYPTRAQGLAASRGATDFGEYFLYFSFFIVVSALLLTVLFFKLGVEQRLREIGILRAVGFPPARIRGIFLAEGLVLALAGSLLGLAGAVLYGRLMMHGLRTWWVDAVGTTALALHVSPASLAMGAAGGVLAALACVVWTLRRLAPASPRSLLAGTALHDASTQPGVGAEKKTARTFVAASLLRRVNASSAAFAFGAVGVVLLLAAWRGLVGQVVGFFGGGTLLLMSLLLFQSAWLRREVRGAIGGRGLWPVSRLGFRSATYRPGRSLLCIALIASAAFIVVAVDAFRRDEKQSSVERKSGSGGFALMAETILPLIQNPNTPEGRDALNLSADDETTAALAGVNFARFRLRPGDDASCLNLYQPRNPRVVAPGDDFTKANRFAFGDTLAETRDEQENPWLLLDREFEDGAVPVVADANSLAYVLHLKLGDVFELSRGGGAPARLRVVGALSDSVFQGELLMSEKNFVRLFPGEEGYRVFLLDTPPDKSGEVARVLEERLADFGFDAQSTAERLANFHRVENTFLSTFQMLGGLGLVLGTLGLAAVLLRNVIERRRELALLRAVGYNRSHFAVMVLAENALLLFCGLVTGTACALLAVAPVSLARGGQLPLTSMGLLLLAVVVAGLASSLVATAAALRAPLIATLRAE